MLLEFLRISYDEIGNLYGLYFSLTNLLLSF